ncbi:MAG: DNA gyrase/topoisomerase IV subunit A [Bacteroidetes bacterium]|nr:MAG: DNA gyrase/topoisomerase IV subunit A [Bacteroidota bacterium]
MAKKKNKPGKPKREKLFKKKHSDSPALSLSASKGKGETEKGGNGEALDNVTHVDGMYQNWFLEYASYVILERAVPYVEDGLKPVQRRILHVLWELEDGRYNKVANIIGQTMKYHPHGDASIGDAFVQIGQKDLLIDTQGNWGNILTGDRAAAPRYIEARLSKFAMDVLYAPKVTQWQQSYDGRNKEPVFLPAKFPLLLAMGVEGIAVGLACKMLPHNFIELIDASISILQGRGKKIYPDFPTGGMSDFSDYNDGKRGGRIRVRAKISQLDKKTLVINEIPFGTTTTSLIESIIAANDKGKIKIKKVEDNTSENVEIQIQLSAGVSPDVTMDALYAFTDCEIAISPNACIIEEEKPKFIGVSEILKISTDRTLGILKAELEVQKAELLENLHFSSLEKIFIEKKIYRDIETCETWEEVMEAIDKGLKPYKKQFVREVTHEDILRLTEIKIKRISKFDKKKADEDIKDLEKKIAQTKHNLANLTEFAVDYFKNLKEKYGKGRERKTEIKQFDTIVATRVAANNVKLYVNREEGFAGSSMRSDEFVCNCSDIDDIIVFAGDGKMRIIKVTDKAFVGKDVQYIGVFNKEDDRTVYHMIYRDGLKGNVYVKRFSIKGAIRDKEYVLTRGNENSKVHYLSVNPNGEAEVITVIHKEKLHLKKIKFDFNFGELDIKGRDAVGNILTKNPVKKVEQKNKGEATAAAIKIWFDETVHRINRDEHGKYIGEFSGDDQILTITKKGFFELHTFDLSEHFDEGIVLIEKFMPVNPVSVVHYDAEDKCYYVKRFMIESGKKTRIISETEGSSVEAASNDANPVAEIIFGKNDGVQPRNKKMNLAEFIDVKGAKAKGNKLTDYKVKEVNMLSSEPETEKNTKAEGKSEKAEVKQSSVSSKKPEAAISKTKKGVKDIGPRVIEFEIVPKKKESVKEFTLEKKKDKVEKKDKKGKSAKKKSKGGKNQMKLF